MNVPLTDRLGALLVRGVFSSNAARMARVMAPFAPGGVTSVRGVTYRAGSKKTTLDVFWPEGTTTPLPTIVWSHGGAWISGSKDNNTAYYQLLAAHGFTVVGLNYSYGPESTYPQAVHDINDALTYLLAHANDVHIDPANVFLAGDSAGAQLSSQIAALTTNPDFASEMGVAPALTPKNLRGLVLNCGVYDLATFGQSTGIIKWGNGVTVRAYTGAPLSPENPAMGQMSVIHAVTSRFPPTYITGGNADPLTAGNSRPFAARLRELGVDVTELFWADDYRPALPHEYQFRLDLDAAHQTLERSIAFVKERVI